MVLKEKVNDHSYKIHILQFLLLFNKLRKIILHFEMSLWNILGFDNDIINVPKIFLKIKSYSVIFNFCNPISCVTHRLHSNSAVCLSGKVIFLV